MCIKAASVWFATLVLAQVAHGQMPAITRIVPASISPGATTTVAIYGENLRGAVNLWTSFPTEEIALLEDQTTARKVEFRIRPRVNSGSSSGAVRIATTNGVSELRLLGFDNFPNASVRSEWTNRVQAARLQLPCAVDGFCRATFSEFFQITMRRGESIAGEVVAQRLGSRLDPLVRLLDARGRELMYCDDQPGLGRDAAFNFRAPASGAYVLEIRDATYRGGEDFFYRLRLESSTHASKDWSARAIGLPVEPSDTLEREPNDTASSAMKLPVHATVMGRFHHDGDRDYYAFTALAGERLVIRGATRSLGSPCDLFLRLSRADGTLIADAEVNGTDDGALTNKFAETGTYHLLVEELNHRGGSNFFYRLSIAELSPGFELSAETNRLEATPGGSFEIKVSCARREFDGPITLSLRGESEGLILLEGQIPEKKNETVLKGKIGGDWPLGKILNLQIDGTAASATERTTITNARARTTTLLNRQFPRIMWPRELDGLIALGVKAAEPAAAPTAK